ncbi:response regulator transcription factor [bacterium]|nr:response regulator transcription factor [bacterium]
MKPPRILVVDDHADFCRLAQMSILAAYPGADIKTASDGRQALTKIRRWKPDLLILDMVMPGLDGLKLIQKLRADPRTARIKILAFSGLVDGIGSQAISAGANAFFRKGLGLKELISTLPEYLPDLRPASLSARLRED